MAPPEVPTPPWSAATSVAAGAPDFTPPSLGPSTSVAGNETVLVVDDDALVRQVVTQLLRAGGYQVLTAQDGAEALTVVKARLGDVALVLTDVMMPRLNGVELARQLRTDQPDLTTSRGLA